MARNRQIWNGGIGLANLASGRVLRQHVLDCVNSPNIEQAIDSLSRDVPLRRLVRPLMSLIRSDDVHLKHRATAALGHVTARLAESNREAARDVIRRLMLTLTEESGGIGWGSPEAIAEILARHKGLVREYGDIFLSYARVDEDTYLDHEPLQRGVLWGVARLARCERELLLEKGAIGCLRPHLRSADTTIRALAAWSVAILGSTQDIGPEWNELLEDTRDVCIWFEGELLTCRVQDLARGTIAPA